MSHFKTILHPTDFSQSASEALRIACSLASQHAAKLILLHVAQRPVSSVAGMSVPPPPPPTVDWSGLRAELHALVEGIKNVSVETRLLEGEPASSIVDLARDVGADLIVIGSHGRTGLSRVLMGSVAEHVVRKAGCPVLTVKTPSK
jgi:nucleotide-binding universal stress UspA family protein